MNTRPRVDDPRLVAPQCHSLIPVKTVHENPWFSVRNRGGYYCVEYNQPQVVVLPIVAQSAVVMVRVKRPSLADVTLELPAGAVENNEEPIQAAARELSEETGLEISEMSRFVELPRLCESARLPCMPSIFQVQVSTEEYEERKSHDDEIESVACLEFDVVAKNIVDGTIYGSHAISILARFLLTHKNWYFERK